MSATSLSVLASASESPGGGFCRLPGRVTPADPVAAGFSPNAAMSAGLSAGGPLVGPPPARLERVLTRSLGQSSIPSLGDGVMLGAAWIDRPVDKQDLHSLHNAPAPHDPDSIRDSKDPIEI